MREMLFRGKCIDNGKWIEGSLIIDERNNHYIGKAIMPKPSSVFSIESARRNGKTVNRFIGIGFAMVIPETVGQFTGLTDKNGTKIFEGDIVKCRHHWQLRVFPREGIDEEEYFFAQKIRGAYSKGVDKENVFIPCERYYYFRNYAVEYFARNGEFRVRNGGQFHPLTRTWIFNRSLEVIGNIHDNPELLHPNASDEVETR